MKTKRGIRILSGKTLRSTSERFDRLQRTANLLAGGVCEPKGVHRFKTWEEFNEWKMKYQVRGGCQTKATS